VLVGLAAAAVHRAVSALVLLVSGGASMRPFSRWDGGWYLDIAAHGYAATDAVVIPGGASQSSVVFPPAFPALLRAVGAVVQRLDVAALIVVFVALAVGLIGLYRLVELQWDARTATWAVIAATAFPASFFFGVVYADAVLFAAVVWAFLAARQRRWWLAGLCLALAGITKSIGFVAAAGVLVELWSARGRARDVVAVLAPPVTALGAWIAYQAAALGEPLKFLAAERQWGRHLSAPWTSIGQGWDAFSGHGWLGGGFPYLLDLVALALLLATAIFAWRRMPRSWAVYLSALALALTLSARLESLDRYALMAFPMFAAAAVATREREWVRPLALLASLALGVLLMQRFATGAWAG
jgi:hypothetical protein